MKYMVVIAMCVAVAVSVDARAELPAPWLSRFLKIGSCLGGPDTRNMRFTSDDVCEITPWHFSEPGNIVSTYQYVCFPESVGHSLVVHVPQDANYSTGEPFLLLRTECGGDCTLRVRLSHGLGQDRIMATGAFNATVPDPEGTIRWMALVISGDSCQALYSRDGNSWVILGEGALECSAEWLLGFGVFESLGGPVTVRFQDISIDAAPVANGGVNWGTLKSQFR